jgi:hypothetical protein
MVCSIEPSLGEVIYTEEAGRGRRLLNRPSLRAVHKTRAQRRVVPARLADPIRKSISNPPNPHFGLDRDWP